MGNFSKTRAIATAFALSVMFMTSTTAKAYQSHDYSYSSSSSVIDSNRNSTTVSASASYYDQAGKYVNYARTQAEINAWTIAVQRGFAMVGNASNYYDYFYMPNPSTGNLDYTYFQLKEGYRVSSDYETTGSGKTSAVTVYLTFTKTVYKNNITGETSTLRSDLTGQRRLKGDNAIPQRKIINMKKIQ